MKPSDPDTITPPDQAKLIAVYKRLCPDDQVTDDDSRRPVIAAEVLYVGGAATIKDALEVIDTGGSRRHGPSNSCPQCAGLWAA